jgi:hypothetical protein
VAGTFLLLLGTSGLQAQGFAPIREAKVTVSDLAHFHDRTFSTAAYAATLAYAADMASTRRAFSRCVSCLEKGILFRGSRSTRNISLAWGGYLAADLVVSHALRRSDSRWVRVVAVLLPLERVAEHAAATRQNLRR